MPSYSSDSDDAPTTRRRLFGREKPLHAILGGGKVADILLWRNKNLSAAILMGCTTIWFLFEVLEYNFVTLLCYISMALMTLIFIWSSGAGIIHKNPPERRVITVPESTFRWLYAKINTTILKLYDVSSGKDLKTFLMAIAFLWVLSGIGNYFSSINLIYTGFICLATVPALYERYQHEVDHLARRGNKDMKKWFSKFDSKVLNKIPRGPVKEKKKF
ncbi:hypothetical protein F511_11699 [Dorcoceras hygrometricum]|uniref:Reticulon-like protein n=1 Tax=Dorcoceras hygrometricum TaxID=472368 RepID=A0A2Z7CCA9_9LAMI|nr:hypothetical protein F511_11699 [Dorcoceras hygrometricum]